MLKLALRLFRAVIAALALVACVVEPATAQSYAQKQIVVDLRNGISPSTGAAYSVKCNGRDDDAPVFNRAVSDYSTPVWRASKTYAAGDVVYIGDGFLYRSLTSGNVGNNPAFNVNPTHWVREGPPPHVIFTGIPLGSHCNFPSNCVSTSSCPNPNLGWTPCGDLRNQLGVASTIPDLTIYAPGVSFGSLTDIYTYWLPGCANGFPHTPHGYYFETVQKGSRCVTMTTAGNAANFVPGYWAYAMGLALQGNSFPPNPAFFDAVLIRSSDAGTGKVCFDRALAHTYKSTWPADAAAADVFQGPPTLFPVSAGWFQSITWEGTAANPVQWWATSSGVRTDNYNVHLKYVTCVVSDPAGLNTSCYNPGFIQYGLLDHYVDPNSIEIDKVIQNLTYKNSTLTHGGGSSGMSVVNLNCIDSTWDVFGTASQNFYGKNCAFTRLLVPAVTYGVPRSFYCDGCSFPDFVPRMSGIDVTTVAYGMSMSAGTITVPTANVISQALQRMFVPGGNYCFGLIFTNLNQCQTNAFQVTDMRQDATNVYIDTNCVAAGACPGGGFPSFPAHDGSNAGTWWYPYEMPEFTCKSCTGGNLAADLNGAPAAAPLWSYTSRTISCVDMAAGVTTYEFGTLVSATYNVTTADTTQPTLKAKGSNVPTLTSSFTAGTRFVPIINLKAAGSRVVTPSGVGGMQMGDSISAPGTYALAGADAFGISSGRNPSGDIPCPSIRRTIQTNPGIVLSAP